MLILIKYQHININKTLTYININKTLTYISINETLLTYINKTLICININETLTGLFLLADMQTPPLKSVPYPI